MVQVADNSGLDSIAKLLAANGIAPPKTLAKSSVSDLGGNVDGGLEEIVITAPGLPGVPKPKGVQGVDPLAAIGTPPQVKTADVGGGGFDPAQLADAIAGLGAVVQPEIPQPVQAAAAPNAIAPRPSGSIDPAVGMELLQMLIAGLGRGGGGFRGLGGR